MVATFSQAVSEPTPRILGIVIQDGVQKGEVTILAESRSVAEVMPLSLASTLVLALQEVDSEKYKLVSAMEHLSMSCLNHPLPWKSPPLNPFI